MQEIQGASVNWVILQHCFFWFGNTGADATIAILLPALKCFSCNGAMDWSTVCFCCEKAFYKNGDSFVITQSEFWRDFGIHCNLAVPSAHAIKTWVQNFEATGSTLKKKGGSLKTVRTPENVVVMREAIERSSHRSAVATLCHSGCLKSQVFKSSSTPHSSGVETSNSARSHTNSCGDVSKSNGWRSQETCQVLRVEWLSSEWCYFQKVGLLFSVC